MKKCIIRAPPSGSNIGREFFPCIEVLGNHKQDPYAMSPGNDGIAANLKEGGRTIKMGPHIVIPH